MAAEIITMDQGSEEQAFSRCRDVLRSGGVVAYPTDTFYGLGVDPGNAAAVRKLFSIKGRQAGQPILLLISRPEDVAKWTAEVMPAAAELMQRHWPGPLTLVFTARDSVLPELTAGSGTIGLRVPGSEPVRRLLASLGTALTGTSANRTGGVNLRTAAEVAESLGDRIDLIVDSGATPGGMPSTVVDVTGPKPRILRQGAVTIA